MAELRSIYEFEKKEEFENAVEGLKYHIGGYSANSTWDYFPASNQIYIYDECSDIAKAASICKEHGGKYRVP